MLDGIDIITIFVALNFKNVADLLIDLGNSNCKAAFHYRGELVQVYKDSGENLNLFLDFLVKEWKNFFKGSSIDIIVFSNVRDEMPLFEDRLREICNKLVVVKDDMELPVEMRYGFVPIGLGADRLAGALAVTMMFPNDNCIKFDFGTALTVDFIDKGAYYAGGNISLGFKTRLRALNHFTKRLPLIEPDVDCPDIGINTSGAITAGVELGLIFEVDGYMNKYHDRKIIFTGGDSLYFAGKLKRKIFVIKNLVLLGLGLIADYYAADVNKN